MSSKPEGSKTALDTAPNVISWRSPSNIALVKYWGKHGRQLPRNPSISFSLSKAYTETSICYAPARDPNNPVRTFLFEGKPHPAFGDRVIRFIDGLARHELPQLTGFDLKIESANSFPHSTGIASSASAMSALALGLCELDSPGNATGMQFWQKASNIARLGSGSASRSVYGGFCIWGKHAHVPESSDLYAVPLPETIDPVFHTLQDSICIVHKGVKSVSSSAGHALMENHPYAESRFNAAHNKCTELLHTLQSGDIERFGEILENEALALHAMMMASRASYLLLEPGTINVINTIRRFRKKHGVPVYFTLDAGPNVHMIYPQSAKDQIQSLLEEVLEFCQDRQWIDDQIGQGPEKR